MTAVRYKRGDCSNKKQHYHWISSLHYWGSKGGRVVRAFASHQYCPCSNPGVDVICGLSFVVGFFSPLLRGVFSPGTPGFPLSSKTDIFRFQFYQESGRRWTTMWMCYLKIVIYYYLFTIIITPPVVAIRSAKLSPSFLPTRSWTGPNTLSMAILGQRRQRISYHLSPKRLNYWLRSSLF